MTYGEKAAMIRGKTGMSQQKFAEFIGANNKQTISDVERGQQKGFKKEQETALAQKLGVDLVWLHGGASVVQDVGVQYNGGGQMSVPVLSIKAAAGGGGNNVESVDVFETGRAITVDRSLFKSPPSSRLRAVQADGYSMVPMLYPDSWVIFEESQEWSGDGLYVLIFRNVLMVKLVEADPTTGQLAIRSVNPDYESWAYDPTQDQSTMHIVGRVLRCVV